MGSKSNIYNHWNFVGTMDTRVPLTVCLWTQTLTLDRQSKRLLSFQRLARIGASRGPTPLQGDNQPVGLPSLREAPRFARPLASRGPAPREARPTVTPCDSLPEQRASASAAEVTRAPARGDDHGPAMPRRQSFPLL